MKMILNFLPKVALLMLVLLPGQGFAKEPVLDCPVAEPMGMTVAGNSLWLSDMHKQSIVQIDKQTGRVLRRIPSSGLMPTGLAFVDGVLYSADRRQEKFDRLRPGKTSGLSPVPYYERWATGMTYDGQHLWVVDARQRRIHKIDPQDGTTILSYPSPGDRPTGIAFDGQYLWLADHKADELYRMSRDSGEVIAIRPAPGPYPSALAVDGKNLWVADYQQNKIFKLPVHAKKSYLEDQERRVRADYQVIYRAGGRGRIKNLTVYLALPGSLPGQHPQGVLKFSPKPKKIVSDRWGQKVAVFELGDLPAGKVRKVSWQGDFSLYRVNFQLDPEKMGRAAISKKLAVYLEDNKKYDLGSETIVELTKKLTKDAPNSYWKARKIYQHLTQAIRYERSSGWNNAAAVLKRGSGSCSEYTFALVALLRKAGIPARYVGAISERGDEASFDDVFHRWAEAWLPGLGWVPVDANAGAHKSPAEQGRYFGGRSNRHVVTTIGGGASDYLDWTYNHNERYQSENGASLEIRPIARYRPLP